MAARDILRNNWPAITITVTAAAIACAAIVMLRSMPPHLIVMGTGPEGDAYYEVGERYRAALASANVEVQLVPTAGSVENLALLLNPHSGVGVGLIEGGIIRQEIHQSSNHLGRSSTSPCGGSISARSEVSGSTVCAAGRYRLDPKAVGRGRWRSN
jgi:hypothetical protein